MQFSILVYNGTFVILTQTRICNIQNYSKYLIMNVEFQIVFKRRKLFPHTEQELTVAICGKNTSN
jgi:hypothetical protein